LTNKDHSTYSSPGSTIMLSDKQRPPNMLKFQEHSYTVWQTKTIQHTQVPRVCWMVFVCQTETMALEYGGWSLFVRQYTFIPRTSTCWVVFVSQTV
jgi:hypothetical protein